MEHDAARLLALRDGTADGEARYRGAVLGLLGAAPVLGLGPVEGKLQRRVEGVVRLPGSGAGGADAVGLVVFAVGDGGAGTLSDVRSKHAEPSARSLLLDDPSAAFVVLVVTGDPPEKLLRQAAGYGRVPVADPVYGTTVVPWCWVIGVAEVVDRARRFDAAAAAAGGGWSDRLRRLLFGGPVPQSPVSPLLLG